MTSSMFQLPNSSTTMVAGHAECEEMRSSYHEALQSLDAIASILDISSACVYIYRGGRHVVQKFERSEQGPGSPGDLAASNTNTQEHVASDHPPHPDASNTSATPWGQEIFGVASLSKILVAVLFVYLIERDQNQVFADDPAKGLEWKTKIYTMLNQLRKQKGKESIQSTIEDITVEEALFHIGLPRMTSFLLGYSGNPLTSKEDFLKHGAKAAEKCFQYSKSVNYSNWNTVLLVALIEEIYEEKFAEIIGKKLLSPLGMKRTVFEDRSVRQWMEDGSFQHGVRISTTTGERLKVDYCRYLDNDIASILLGCYSCVEDFAKLFTAILQALYDPDAKSNGSSIITRKIAKRITHHRASQTRTLIGQRGPLNSAIPGSDALDVFSRSRDKGPSYTLGTAHTPENSRAEIIAHYKGGVVDGYTNSVYLLVAENTFVIVMCSGLGAIDFADRACHVMLQRIFDLKPSIDFVSQTRSDLAAAKIYLNELEKSDLNIPQLNSQFRRLVGKYRCHIPSSLRLEITPSGHLIKYGSSDRSDKVKVRVVDQKILIYADEGPLAIDRRSDFIGVSFEVEHGMYGTTLTVRNGWNKKKEESYVLERSL